MFGIWLALLGVRRVAEGFFYVGIALALIATGYYLRDGSPAGERARVAPERQSHTRAAESQAQLDPRTCAAILAQPSAP